MPGAPRSRAGGRRSVPCGRRPRRRQPGTDPPGPSTPAKGTAWPTVGGMPPPAGSVTSWPRRTSRSTPPGGRSRSPARTRSTFRSGATKLDLVEYYLAVGQGILRALRDRPTTLERYPDGVDRAVLPEARPKSRPEWIPTAHITFPSGRTADEMCPTEVAAVACARNLGTLTFHPWPVRRADVDHPDELRIDLDPQPGTDFADAARAATSSASVLDEHGLRGWPKTSGGRGIHVFVPIEPRWTFTQVRRAAIALGRELERRMPEQVTTAWWKEERGERDLRRLQPDRPRPHDRLRLLGAPPPARPRLRPAALGRGAATSTRGTSTSRPCPRRFAELGDVHADMDDRAYSPRRAAGAGRPRRARPRLGDLPYPPEYPKMPGEPKRVQPSKARPQPGEGGRA